MTSKKKKVIQIISVIMAALMLMGIIVSILPSVGV